MDEVKVDVRTIICPHCGYEWPPRVESPKKCPKCQKWLPTPEYEMRFVPYDALGKRKKGVPFIGGERGYEDGEIVSLPLEKRHESWWELVDEKSVPKTELKRDQKKRDAFLVKADAAAALRAKQLARDDRPADIVA